MEEYKLELKQIVDYPRCRMYRQFIQGLIGNMNLRVGKESYLYYYTVLCSYANFRTSYHRVKGVTHILYPGEWICRIEDMKKWFRAKSQKQVISIMEKLQEKITMEYEEFKKNAEEELERRLGSAEREAEEAKKKARQIVDSARATSDYILKQLDEAKKAKDAENFGDKISDAKKNIKGSVKDYRQNNAEEDKDDGYVLPRDLKKGDDVIHRTLGTKGTLIEDPDKKGNVMVQMGILKTKLNVSQLKLVEGATVTENGKKSAARTYRQAVTKSFKPELDVRGMIGDDACFMVDRYLDDAFIAQIYSVTVIHGKGTGALRSAVTRYLKASPFVKSSRLGVYGEGEDGVTIVTLK